MDIQETYEVFEENGKNRKSTESINSIELDNRIRTLKLQGTSRYVNHDDYDSNYLNNFENDVNDHDEDNDSHSETELPILLEDVQLCSEYGSDSNDVSFCEFESSLSDGSCRDLDDFLASDFQEPDQIIDTENISMILNRCPQLAEEIKNNAFKSQYHVDNDDIRGIVEIDFSTQRPAEKNRELSVNQASVIGATNTGIGHNQLLELMASMNIHYMTHASYSSYQESLVAL
ncbi:hypothetical protein TKK_0002944 [Trichogramma kaykai]